MLRLKLKNPKEITAPAMEASFIPGVRRYPAALMPAALLPRMLHTQRKLCESSKAALGILGTLALMGYVGIRLG